MRAAGDDGRATGELMNCEQIKTNGKDAANKQAAAAASGPFQTSASVRIQSIGSRARGG